MDGAKIISPQFSRRSLVLHGVFWTGAVQVFVAGISFCSMLVLVRLISPGEYGRAVAANGFLALINCFSCSHFITHAIQLKEGETPDWEVYWRVAVTIQLVLGALCNLVAGFCWLIPTFRPVAPLLHLASIGLFIDAPNQLALVILRREMDFRRLRVAQGIAAALTALATIFLALQGAGACSLIVGSNVLAGLPYGFDLLFVKKWRAPKNWWGAPNWKTYRDALRFGAQLSATALLAAGRGILESMILPGAIGYSAMGLFNRAQVLFTTTIGRLNCMVIETVYPLLPASAGDPAQFSRHCTLFVQVLLFFSIPGAAFIAMQGPLCSRLLYGQKWMNADPLIVPGTLFAFGVGVVLVLNSVVLAANRLRGAFLPNVVVAAVTVPAILIAVFKGKILNYAWALAIGQLAAMVVAFGNATRHFRPGWIVSVLLPPVISTASGVCAIYLLSFERVLTDVVPFLFLRAVVFFCVFFLMMRMVFPSSLNEVFSRLPGGEMFLKKPRI